MARNGTRTKLSEKGLLTSDNCIVALIDHQPQMLFGVANFDRCACGSSGAAGCGAGGARGLGTGARGRGARARRALMLPSLLHGPRWQRCSDCGSRSLTRH
jgi:hypothetical protein